MKKECLKYVYILILYANALLSQSIISSADFDSRGKVYINEWIEAPVSVDRFGHPSPSKRKINIRVIGPANISVGSQESFYVDLIPEDNLQDLGNHANEIIRNFKMYMVSSEGFIKFNPKPKYNVLINNSGTYTQISDITKDNREFYYYIGEALPAFLSAIPVIGQVIGLSSALKSTNDWLNAEENDWEKNWEYESNYDTFPILKPIFSKPTELARRYEIELPFTVIGSAGDLFLINDFITVCNQNNLQNCSVFKNEKFVLFTQTKNSIRPIELINNNFEISPFKIKVNNNISLQIKAEIVVKNGKNILSLFVEPESITDVFVHLEDINIALQIDKDVGKISEMPEYYNYKGQYINYLTSREMLGRDALANWFRFGVGLIPTYGSIYGASQSAVDIIEAANNAQSSSSFSEMITELWKTVNNTNFYQLPAFSNLTSGSDEPFVGKHGFQIDIPISFYSNSPDGISVFLKTKIHWGPSKLKTGNYITGTTALESYNTVAYKIPLKFEEKYDDQLSSDKLLNIVIFDNSSSMSQKSKGTSRSKFEEARIALTGILKNTSDHFDWSLITFNGCSVINNFSNISNKEIFYKTLIDMRVGGSTPIGKSLEKAIELYSLNSHYKKVSIILLTDGEETCNKSLLRNTARSINNFTTINNNTFSLNKIFYSDLYANSTSTPLEFFVVGFATSSSQNRSLKKLTSTAGGEFYSAANLPQLQDKLRIIITSIEGNDKTIIIILLLLVFIGLYSMVIIFAVKNKISTNFFSNKDLRKIRLINKNGKSFTLNKKLIKIGRSKNCDLVLKGKYVSKNHCNLYFDKSTLLYQLKLLSKTNSVWVNNKKVKEVFLHDGDKIKIANYNFKIRYSSLDY